MVAETVGVLGVVDFEVEVAEAGDDVAADGGVALADGGGENEGVGAVQAGSHLADGALDAIDKEVVGKFGLGIAVVTEADDLAKIIGGAGDAEETAFFVEVGFKIVALEFEFATDGEGGGGVNVAAAGGHHEALKRSVAHGGIKGLARFQSGDGAARTEVTDDHLVGGELVLVKVVSDGANGEAVEAVALDFGAAGEVLVNGVVGVDSVAGGVEGRVRDDDNWGALENLEAGGDFGGDHGDVKRSAGFGNFKLAETFVVNQVVSGEIFAGGNDPGEDGGEFGLGAEITLVGEDALDVFYGVSEFLETSEFLLGAIGGFEGADDAFKFKMQRADKSVVAVEGVFARGRARVGDKKKF